MVVCPTHGMPLKKWLLVILNLNSMALSDLMLLINNGAYLLLSNTNRVENARIQYQNVDLRVLTDRWKQPGDIAQFKDIKNADSATMPTSRFVQDKAYLRLSALTLSYDFNREWIKKYLGMNMLRLEASTRDFINWNSIRQERGLSYPKSWTVDFSIKAQF